MQKVNLSFDAKYPFLFDIMRIYECYSDIDNVARRYEISSNAKRFIKLIENNYDQPHDIWDFVDRKIFNEIIIPNPNKVIVCFSGGKDSVNIALKLKERYDVILYYIKGINHSYPNEIDSAIECAKALDLPLVVQEVKLSGRTTFLENPTKNQLIFACALNYGLAQGVVTYYFGNAENESVENANFDRDFSDSKEMFDAFSEWVVKDLAINIINEPLIKDGIDSIVNLGKERILGSIVQSCLLPYRFQRVTHKNNCEKYGIELPPNLCGSCWKCCVQYIVWADKGWLEYNKGFYYHCLDFLKSKSLAERGKKTKTYKETYIAFISEELYQESILRKETKQ